MFNSTDNKRLLMNSILIKYAKTVSHYFTASLIPLLLNLAINPLVSIAMTPEDYAIVGYFSSFSALIAPIILFYLVHYYNKRYFELDDSGRIRLRALLFKMLICFSTIVAIVCVISIFIYIRCQSDIHFKTFPYLYMSVMAIPFTGIYSLQLAQYKMERNSKRYMYYSVTNGLLGVLFTLLFVVIFRWGAFGKLLGPLVINVLFFVFVLINNRDVWGVRNSFSEMKPIIVFCLPLVIGASLGFFSNGYDKAILAKLGNNVEYGYYCVGASIAGYLGVFTSSLSATFQPDIYQAIISDDRKKLIKVASLRWLLTLGIVIAFVLLCPIIIKILTAGRYMQSTGYARVFACICLVSSIYYIINDYTIARGVPRLYLYTTVIGTCLIVVLMPIFIRWKGYYGGAIANIVSYAILCVVNVALLSVHGALNKRFSI